MSMGGEAHQGIRSINASRRVRTGEATKTGEKPKMLQQEQRNRLNEIIHQGFLTHDS